MKTIEDFLDSKLAADYSIKNHHFFKILREVFGSRSHLYSAYTIELREVERFRSDLAGTLARDPADQPKVAERWALFLKSRSTVMEFWSGLSSAFVAVFGLGSTLFALVAVATKQEAPISMLLSFLAVSALFVTIKFYIDKRAFWFKFVAGHLEAIAKVGANPSFNGTPTGAR